MGEPEHMTGFVREHLAAPAQQERRVIGRARFSIKRRVVSGKAVNADSLAQRSLPKNKIPRRLRVKIFHRDGDNAEGVARKACLKKIENIAGENLLVASVRISASAKFRVVDLDWRERLYFDCEECRRKLPQFIDCRTALGRKIAQRLEVKHMSILRESIRSRRFELIERLSRLRMHSEPVVRPRFWNGIKTIAIGRKG